MSKFQKAKERLLSIPGDFTWDELQVVLKQLGYALKKNDGSRRSFVHSGTGHKISLHEPHPQNIVKKYALRLVVEALDSQGLI